MLEWSKFSVYKLVSATGQSSFNDNVNLVFVVKKRYPRTDKDFVITSIEVLKKIVQTFTDAGFEHISDPIIHRRFFELVKFLQENELTIRLLMTDKINSNYIELKNSDINDKGFYFLQYALPKWEGRLYKDQGGKKEYSFLEKWYRIFRENNPDLS